MKQSSPRGERCRLTSILLAVLAFSSCQKAPEDLREWRPSDHQNTSNAEAAAKGQTVGDKPQRQDGLDEVTITTWQAKCVSCHGRIGLGDGPQSSMFNPQDLTDPVWQSAVTDARILESIQKGRNRMPGFALPESTAASLVKLVRLLGRARLAASAPNTTSSSQPSSATSAAPTATTTNGP